MQIHTQVQTHTHTQIHTHKNAFIYEQIEICIHTHAHSTHSTQTCMMQNIENVFVFLPQTTNSSGYVLLDTLQLPNKLCTFIWCGWLHTQTQPFQGVCEWVSEWLREWAWVCVFVCVWLVRQGGIEIKNNKKGWIRTLQQRMCKDA